MGRLWTVVDGGFMNLSKWMLLYRASAWSPCWMLELRFAFTIPRNHLPANATDHHCLRGTLLHEHR